MRHDDLLGMRGGQDQLLGRLQAQYGRSRALIEVRVRKIERDV